ncbi:MAG TPA: AmmeMemoRadiSam system radical SAM enzyme [bacterium]|mgnify:CR=1 FL=1|nr:AmmeMemoRadiSam system radical SAM enzyme [bacterium]
MKKASLFRSLEERAVQCLTCAHHCRLKPGQRGVCGVRENREGDLYSLVYGRAVALHADPIEKKPLYHFLPGASALSLATVGCNMTCMNCQNSDISQWPRNHPDIPGEWIPPDRVVSMAEERDCRILAFTYTEPAVFWDYAHDTSVLSVRRGMKNVFVTNGYLSVEAIDGMASCLHGANVDLKSFSDKTYRQFFGARLKPVLRTIQALKKLDIWVEVTTLLIPGLNDSDEELREIARFISETDVNIPWHVSRFCPAYRMLDRPPTRFESIHRACGLGREAGLRFVYAGNIPGDERENTRCPSCRKTVVRRRGYQITDSRIKEGRCGFCGAALPGVWS